jgi:1-acyl-sn-glycerol-3-phosphate acyltransferase
MVSPKTHVLIRIWRIFRIFCHLLWGVLLAALWLPLINAERRQGVIMAWSAGVMRLLHVRLAISGQVPGKDATSVMFVANHISWLDIWAINSIQPVRFVAKSDVRNWPVIGWLSKKTGVIFIQRERRRDTARVSSLGAQVLLAGECLCVFPEGTTTEGEYMLPFRSSLLQAAIDAEATIWPIALRYPMDDGSANTAVAYAGETTLWESICAIVAQPSIAAELVFLPPIAAQRDRRAIAQAAQDAVQATLNLPLREGPETPADLPLAML